MAVEIRTARGAYRITEARDAERTSEVFVLTIAMERSDGIEKIVLRCRLAASLPGITGADPEAILKRLAPWFEREFEQTREAALKSIRTERKLFEVAFDEYNRGPFQA